jgi:ABC-type sugar transport system substrate-binding protein
MRSWMARGSCGDNARICAYFIMTAGVIGCDRQPAVPAGDKPPPPGQLIVLIGPGPAGPEWPAIAGGARRFIEEQCPSLRLETATPATGTAAALLRAVDESLSKDPRAICLYVTDPAAARPAVSKIIASGAILVTMGVACDVAGVFGHVQVDPTGAAELLGERLPEIAGGKRSYVLLHRRGATPVDTHCYERFMRKARSSYSITLLEEQNAAEAEQPATELLQAMFTRFRYAGLAVTLDPTPWLATPPAALPGDNARFATLGAAPALWPYLRSGAAAALVGPVDGEIGSRAAELALVGIADSGEAGLVRAVRNELVTPETLGDFARRYAEAAGLDVNELLSGTTTSRRAASSSPAGEP